jgi:hypothetical protein
MTEQVEEYDTDEFFEDESEFLRHYEFDDFLKPCPGCFGTGLDRELDSDCLTCWGEGVV